MRRLPKLSPLMRNMYGYEFAARRTMLHSCKLQLFIYGSSVFYEKLSRKRILNSIEKVEHRCNVIIAQSYQDINHGVSCILTGSPHSICRSPTGQSSGCSPITVPSATGGTSPQSRMKLETASQSMALQPSLQKSRRFGGKTPSRSGTGNGKTT